jgi:HK97 family phage major capsid protein
LLAASLIGAPAAVLVALLMIPGQGMTEGEAEAPPLYSSTMEALVQGTGDGLQLLLGIMATLIVFVALVALVNRDASEEIRELVEDDYLNGTGVGRPFGLLANATLQAAAIHSGHASTIPTADPLLRMIYGVNERFLPNARWMMRRATELSLMLLKDGTGRYVWQPSMQAAVPNALFGYPISYNGFMPAVGASAFPVAFGDFRQLYQIVANTLVMSLRDEITAPGYVKLYTEIQKGGDVRRTDAGILLEVAA